MAKAKRADWIRDMNPGDQEKVGDIVRWADDKGYLPTTEEAGHAVA